MGGATLTPWNPWDSPGPGTKTAPGAATGLDVRGNSHHHPSSWMKPAQRMKPVLPFFKLPSSGKSIDQKMGGFKWFNSQTDFYPPRLSWIKNNLADVFLCHSNGKAGQSHSQSTILSWGLPNGGRNCGFRRQRLRGFPGSRLGWEVGSRNAVFSLGERSCFMCFFPCVGGFPNFLVGKTGRLRSLEQHNGSSLLFPTASPRPWPRACRNSWCACASSETVNWQSWRTSFRPPRKAIWACHGRHFGPRQARWMVRLGKLIEWLIVNHLQLFWWWMTGEYAWIVHILAALAFRLSGCWGLFRWNPPRGCWSLRKFRVWVDQWTLILSHVCGFVGARKIEAKVCIK